jgi:hypothetical protein
MAVAIRICRWAFAGVFERITAGGNEVFGETAPCQHTRLLLTQCPRRTVAN